MFHQSTRLGTMILLALAVLAATFSIASADPGDAKEILKATGVQGGLVVHLGVGDGKMTAALRPNNRYLVQGLDTDAGAVAKTRELLKNKGIYGPVSAEVYDGKNLPYVENTVNLLVASDVADVSKNEIMRVLAPEGVAYVNKSGKWTKTVKPRPEEIDEWSHFLHDSGGNAVANDEKIGPPKRLRWVAGPRWCRTHEIPSSVNAVVTAGGRIFTIFDDGVTGVYKKLPWNCNLIARDASNGVFLWKVPMQKWQPEFGTGEGNRWNIHHTLPRRLIAGDDRVYVTLQFMDSPVSVLDAATGEVLTEALEGTTGTDEMVLDGDILITKLTKKRSVPATARVTKEALEDTLAAVDVKTGKQLWRKKGVRVVPYALSAKDGRVVYHNMDELVCLDAKTGKEVWRCANPIPSTQGGNSTLVIIDDVVLFHGNTQALDAPAKAPAKPAPAAKGKKKKKPAAGLFLTAISLDNGKPLWQHRGMKGCAAACTQPTDVFVARGVVWCGGSLSGRDLHTGEVKKTVQIGKLISPGHHYRCHRSKASDRFLIWPKRGAEFVDLEGDEHMRNDWLRAPCFTGLTPANGLLYVPPSQCFCYPGVKVYGFLAMSAEPAKELKASTDANLTRGPAYGKVTAAAKATAADWPMYRRNNERSGSTKTAVPTEPKKKWEIDLASKGSQAVVVGDRLYIAEKDVHRIRCLNADTGKDVWSFTAGGRVDSSPTVTDGMVLFGCADGSVYCLRATDGELVWRFQATPNSQQIVSYGQLESLWPVQGSVLVQDGKVYFAAGRSSFLDGGILVYALDAKTGKVLNHHLLEGPWPEVMTETGAPFAMEGALPDLLVSDGEDLYMQRIKFDPKLTRLETKQESSLGELDMGKNHLVATGGFLDDTGFDRVYWMYSNRWPGFYFSQFSPKAGQLVVFDDSTTYAIKYFYRRIMWSPAFLPAEDGYLLFADDNDNQPILEGKGETQKAINWLPGGQDKFRRGGRGVEKGSGYSRAKPAKWQTMIPLRIRAMVLAGDHLFAAGLPDVVEEDDPVAAFEGRKGIHLQTFSAKDGSLVHSQELKSIPAFDGLSAAAGRLYLTTADGKLICFGK